MGAERGMGSAEPESKWLDIGMQRLVSSPARQPSASRAQIRTTSGSMVNLAYEGWFGGKQSLMKLGPKMGVRAQRRFQQKVAQTARAHPYGIQ